MIVRFVAITKDDSFYQRLDQLASILGWRIGRADSTDEALTKIGETSPLIHPTPMVVFDSTADDDWRLAFERLRGLPAQPCLLLASPFSDDYLLQEVVRHHGYDILPKSAPSDKLMHRLNFAWFWARAKHSRKSSKGNS